MSAPEGEGMRIELPEMTARRGGIRYGEQPPRPKPPRTVDPAPEGAGLGRWRYGLRGDDGEVLSSHSGYSYEPFTSREEALAERIWFDGTLVRAWIPNVEWEDAP